MFTPSRRAAGEPFAACHLQRSRAYGRDQHTLGEREAMWLAKVADMPVRTVLRMNLGFRCPVCGVVHSGLKFVHEDHRNFCSTACFRSRPPDAWLPWKMKKLGKSSHPFHGWLQAGGEYAATRPLLAPCGRKTGCRQLFSQQPCEKNTDGIYLVHDGDLPPCEGNCSGSR